jgi:hypothetical protein
MIQLRGTVSLTDRQASWIRRYADALPTASRGPFIEFVKDRLVGEPGDLAVEAAIFHALDRTKEHMP